MSRNPSKKSVLICLDYRYFEVTDKEALAIMKALNNKPVYCRNYDRHTHGGPDFCLDDEERRNLDISIETGTIGPKPTPPPKPKKVLSITHDSPRQLPLLERR